MASALLYFQLSTLYFLERGSARPMATDEERTARSLQRAAEAEEEARGGRRDALLTLAVCVLWAALGLFLVMWSAHTDNVDHGRIALGAGLVIGNGGIVVTLIHAWYRAQRKG